MNWEAIIKTAIGALAAALSAVIPVLLASGEPHMQAVGAAISSGVVGVILHSLTPPTSKS